VEKFTQNVAQQFICQYVYICTYVTISKGKSITKIRATSSIFHKAAHSKSPIGENSAHPGSVLGKSAALQLANSELGTQKPRACKLERRKWKIYTCCFNELHNRTEMKHFTYSLYT
jgi:hypothetical protein